MTYCNRDTLRKFFEDGRRPTGSHFSALIDSTLNMSDEGFRKSDEHGFEIISDEALLSFYSGQDGQNDLEPNWSVNLAGDRKLLQIRTGDGRAADAPPPVLTLDVKENPAALVQGSRDATLNRAEPHECRVGIGTDQPQVALDVHGVVASHGRRGHLRRHTPDGQPLLANGQWHRLTGPLQGCQMLEITAGVGVRDEGRFALIHAIAMNTYNPLPRWLPLLPGRKPIRSLHAWYGQRCDRLELRWRGDSGKNSNYWLEIRTQCDYKLQNAVIQASVSALWHDAHMNDGAQK